MSDNYDQYLDALQPETAEKRPRRSRTTKNAPASVVQSKDALSEQRGKRAREDYEQVNASVPAELKAKAFFYLKMNAAKAKKLRKEDRHDIPTNLSDLIEDLLSSWVEKQGGEGSAKRTLP